MPLTGILTACAASQTMRTAMAWMAGPETPPVGLERRLLRVRTSMDMPLIVLMSERASAPSASQARATSGTRTGAILTRSGRCTRGRTARTTSAALSGVPPTRTPPRAMLGQEMFISTPLAQGQSSSMSSTAATYSSTAWPAACTMTRQPRRSSPARYSPYCSTIPRTPGLASPTVFIMPLGTSHMRGAGLPGQGSAEQPLRVIAPRRETSKKSSKTEPKAKVPEAVLTGFCMRTPPRSTAMLTPFSAMLLSPITTPPPRRRRRVRPCSRTCRCRRPWPRCTCRTRQSRSTSCAPWRRGRRLRPRGRGARRPPS